MKKILFFVYGDLFPVDAGNKRLIVEILSYLMRSQCFHITLVVVCSEPQNKMELEKLCHRLVLLKEPHKSLLLHAISYPFIKSKITTLQLLIFGLKLRRMLKQEFSRHTYIIINYISWYHFIPPNFLNRSIVITHDLQFFREKSFAGAAPSLFQKFHIHLNRILELRALKKFRKVIILADYEYKILSDLNFPMDKVIKIGMPLSSTNPPFSSNCPYDFLMVGGNSTQNESGFHFFFEKILPLVLPRHTNITIAIAGGLSNSSFCRSISQTYCGLKLLGYCDNLDQIYAKTKIVISTPIYGSGIKVKTVEAMLYGKCVLSNNKGLEGIPWTMESVINMDHYSEEKLAVLLDNLLNDQNLREKYGKQAKALISQEFAPEKTLKYLLQDLTA